MPRSVDSDMDAGALPLAYKGPGRSGVLEALWDIYPDNLFLIRVEKPGRFVVEAVNSVLRERFNLPASAIEEKTIEEIHDSDVARDILGRYRECLLADRPIHYEEPSRSPIAEDDIFETILMPLRDTEGQVSHLLGISRAITRLRRAEQALRQSNRDLEQRLERKREESAQLRQSLRASNIRDELTACYRRAIFMEMANRELARSEQNGGTWTMLIADVDGLAELNRSFGRSAGDAMISTVVTLIRESLSGWELLGRCDSGEFIMLVERDGDAANALADALCRQVSDLQPQWQGRPITLSISIGVGVPAGTRTPSSDQLGRTAVEALGRAREQGPGSWFSQSMT